MAAPAGVVLADGCTRAYPTTGGLFDPPAVSITTPPRSGVEYETELVPCAKPCVLSNTNAAMNNAVIRISTFTFLTRAYKGTRTANGGWRVKPDSRTTCSGIQIPFARRNASRQASVHG